MPRYVVIVAWEDRGVEDADEIEVVAENQQGAIQRAKRRWREAVFQSYPACRIVQAFILTAAKKRALA